MRPRSRWRTLVVGGGVVVLSAILVGQKCMCPNPASAFPSADPSAATVQGELLRRTNAAPPAIEPSSAAAPAVEPSTAATPPATGTVAATSATSPPEETRAPTPPAAATAKKDGKKSYTKRDWAELTKFAYVPPPPDDGVTRPADPDYQPTPIPEDILALSGTRTVIEGYTVPLAYDKGIVTKFILIDAPLPCCFAEAPPMTHWITVTNPSRIEYTYSKFQVMRVSGVFDAGEEKNEGFVTGIYRMTAEKIEPVE